jgi:tryptophan-rich sensory protein
MAVAAWRLSRAPAARTPLTLHAVQLALNAAWPVAFFGARSKRVSVAIIVALDLAVGAEIATAERRDRVAAALLAPYLAWTLFATALNIAVEPADAD